MEIKVAEREEKDLELIVEDEDLSLAEIIHHELLDDDRIAFAGVKAPHPLLRKLVLRVQTKRGKPIEAVVDSGEKALKRAAEFLEATQEIVLKGYQK